VPRSYRPAAEIQAVVAARLRPDGRRRVDGRDRASGLTRTEYWLPDGTAAAPTALSNTVRTMRRVYASQMSSIVVGINAARPAPGNYSTRKAANALVMLRWQSLEVA